MTIEISDEAVEQACAIAAHALAMHQRGVEAGIRVDDSRDAAELVAKLVPVLERSIRDSIDVAHLTRQREWSERTFGPGSRLAGVTDHIAKELGEIRSADRTSVLEEWVDVIILAFDGAWRSGATPEQIIAAVKAKQAKNEARIWPDWRTADPNAAIEHVREPVVRGSMATPNDQRDPSCVAEWPECHNGGGRIHVSGDDGRPRELIADMEGDDRQIATAYNEADRELLLAARTAVPSLLAEVSRLQAQNEQLLEFKFVHQGCGVLRGKVKLARAERDAALARLAAVEKLLEAVDEASLRPEPENFEPIEVPWTVAVRAALSATPGEDGKR